MSLQLAEHKRERPTFDITTKEGKQAWLEARVANITSTEVSALFNCGYETLFQLWHRKLKKQDVAIEETTRMKWGKRYEDPTAKGVAEDEGWKVRRWNQFVYIPDLRIGSSYDWQVLADEEKNIPTSVFEIKQVSFDQQHLWIVEKDYVEAPEKIEFQMQHQLLVSGLQHGIICVQFGGNDVRLLPRVPDPGMHKAILSECEKFWHSIDHAIEPEFDPVRDAKYLAEMYGYAEPGKKLDAVDDVEISSLCSQYCNARDNKKLSEEDMAAFKSQLLPLIGENEKIFADGYTISAKVLGPAKVAAHTKKGYRNFKVSKKEKTS